VIRIAAVGDLHLGADALEAWTHAFEPLADEADLLLLAGDLTRTGTPAEAELVAMLLDGVPVPTLAVLGNHDHHAEREDELVKRIEGVGVLVLEGTSATLQVGATTVGVAGAKGFGGGFAGACGSEFGEREMKAFVAHTRERAAALGEALASLDADLRVALLHYAPVDATLLGERREIYPFLGSYLLAEAIDEAGADLVLHGHAHAGTEKGRTPGGIPVRNVAQPVIRSAYRLFCLGAEDDPLRPDGCIDVPGGARTIR
jgi:Icc-related predicted phosphoesterase